MQLAVITSLSFGSLAVSDKVRIGIKLDWRRSSQDDDDNFISSTNSAPTKVIGTSLLAYFGSEERLFVLWNILRNCHLVSLSRMKNF